MGLHSDSYFGDDGDTSVISYPEEKRYLLADISKRGDVVVNTPLSEHLPATSVALNVLQQRERCKLVERCQFELWVMDNPPHWIYSWTKRIRFHAPTRSGEGLIRNIFTSDLFSPENRGDMRLAFTKEEGAMTPREFEGYSYPAYHTWKNRGEHPLSIWDIVAWAHEYNQKELLKRAVQQAFWKFWNPQMWKELTGEDGTPGCESPLVDVSEMEHRLREMAKIMPLTSDMEEILGIESNWSSWVGHSGSAARVTAMLDHFEEHIGNEKAHKNRLRPLMFHRKPTPCKLLSMTWKTKTYKEVSTPALLFENNGKFHLFNNTSIVGVVLFQGSSFHGHCNSEGREPINSFHR